MKQRRLYGHDLTEETWSANVQTAADSFDDTPYILQRFHKSARKTVCYYDFLDDTVKSARARAAASILLPDRRSPYLSGIQAVVCPPDKKSYGMIDAVAPCAVSKDANAEDAF